MIVAIRSDLALTRSSDGKTLTSNAAVRDHLSGSYGDVNLLEFGVALFCVQRRLFNLYSDTHIQAGLEYGVCAERLGGRNAFPHIQSGRELVDFLINDAHVEF